MRLAIAFISALLLSIFAAGHAAADRETQATEDVAPMGAIYDLFAAISAMDADAMRASSAADFHLLEAGEVWDMGQLIDAINRKPENVTRRNFFAPVRTVIDGDRAWVSYWNKAVFENHPERDAVVWLESAVLTRKNGMWLIDMLHSTRLRNDQALPANVTLVEMK